MKNNDLRALIAQEVTRAQLIEAIKTGMPEGNKQKMTADSEKEQTHSELDKCSKEQIEKFKLLNKDYKQIFGFPFIVCISGMDRFKILNLFEKRINNNKNSEFEEAKIQVKKIALLRLQKINKE